MHSNAGRIIQSVTPVFNSQRIAPLSGLLTVGLSHPIQGGWAETSFFGLIIDYERMTRSLGG